MQKFVIYRQGIQFQPHRTRVVLSLVGAWLALLVLPSISVAANPSGDLQIDVITAYNLVVDSNIESPSTYAPAAATLGAKFCNDGANDLTDVSAYIGNFDPNNDSNAADSTPGVYPSVTNPSTGQVGTFSLTHEGGSAGTLEGRRYIGTIAAGKCVTQYWLISYPRLDDNGDSVTRGIKPDDDLVLHYDLWATGLDAGTPLQADVTRTATMRNEISAAANKIWPNGDNKVPEAYRTVIDELVGWDTTTPSGTSDVYPGEVVQTQGIWYDLGNVGQGFDNNGDYVPDQNAWMQPIGDASAYDPGCFRLVRTYGIVIVKLKSGGELLIPFIDQLYFESIPDNTGVVGLVYYEFVALDGVCTASMSPYQEVASGADNEKFSGDYGVAIPPLVSREPEVVLEKIVNQMVIGPALPATLLYTLQITNTGTISAGNLQYGLPLVVQDQIPAGTVYVAGSATANNTLPAGVTAYQVFYSTNAGSTWTSVEPVAASVTNIQWWLNAPLSPSASGSVAFQVSVPNTYTNSIVPNTGALSYGNASPFTEDDAITFIIGNNSVGDTIFRDNGAGSFFANGSQDAGELGIPNVTVTLYYDLDNDAVLDSTDLLWNSTTSNASGVYGFATLPDGKYLVVVDRSDADLPLGWTSSSSSTIAINLDAAHSNTNPIALLTADFGFAPALEIEKTQVGTSPIYESDRVTYTIDLTNRLPGSGTPTGAQCTYTSWAGSEDADTSGLPTSQHFDLFANVFGVSGPNTSYAESDWSNARDKIAGTAFNPGTPAGSIIKVEALFSIYLNGLLTDDYGEGFLFFNNSQLITPTTFSTAQLNAFASTQAAQGYLIWDVTATSVPHTWNWSDFAGTSLDLELDTVKNTSTDGRTIFLDAIGFRITSNTVCPSTPSNTIVTLPLTDTYNAAQLEFVSAQPPVDRSTPAGTLAWNNLAPLYPGQTKVVTVTFLAQQPTTNPETVNNVATTQQGRFADDRLVNSATATATVTLSATGSISGVVWNDKNSNGWPTGSLLGYETLTDTKVANVTVTLYACKDGSGNLITTVATNKSCSGNGGSWQTLLTQTTGSDGSYRFNALRDGYYYVAIDRTTIPGNDTPTGDPNQKSGLCSTCDNQSNGAADNLNPITFLGRIANANDVPNLNFGYSVPPALYGNLWEDNDGDGIKESGENGLGAATVQLFNSLCSGSVLTSTTTNTNGNYYFGDRTSGTTYCIKVLTATLPAGTTWIETAETDLSINNQITVTAQSGVISGSHDYGFHRSGASQIGNTLYYDWNGNGTQESGEEGIPNIAVALYEDNNGDGTIDVGIDALVMTASTNLSGTYLFSNLAAGNYLVRVDENDPQFPTYVSNSADPDESGHCIICDSQSKVTVNGTNSDLTKDFGYQPLGTGNIGDTVWIDQNGDGNQVGARETGVLSVTVRLWADLNGDGVFSLVMTTTTNASGHYLFADLPDGSYRVVVDSADPDLPVDGFGGSYVATTATTRNITISNGNTDLTADFGFAALAAIGDTIFWDANANGSQDWTESGIAGVSVWLINAQTTTLTINGIAYAPGATISTTPTANGSGGSLVGSYLFSALPPGRYTVRVSPSGPISTSLQTADPDRDGTACADTTYPGLPACDNESTTTVYYGTSFMGVDFGYQPTGVIGDYVWFDQNGNGLQESGEAGIANIPITVTNGVITYTTATDYDGFYFFQGLTAGNWTLRVGTPANTAITSSGNFTNVVNGIGSIGSTTTTVTIDASGSVTQIGGNACSDCALHLDFGFAMNGAYTLTGKVCLEENGITDGLCDDLTDSPVVTYTLNLYSSTGQYLGATTTNSNGSYTFTNLIEGVYIISIGPSVPPLDTASLTTNAANTPATTITTTFSSVYQTVPVNATSATSDGGSNVTSIETVDFAFVSNVTYDYGDLPAPYNTTLTSAPSGARHSVPSVPTLYLGAIAPDGETNGIPSLTATGDGADEDGITPFNPQGWVTGTNGGSLTAQITGLGWLIGWIDFNNDGDFTDTGEMIVNQSVTSGNYTLPFNIPTGTISALPDTLYSRFRLFSAAPPIPVLAYSGAATGGEVEDYQWSTEMPVADLVVVKYDLLDPIAAGAMLTYTIVLTNNGPSDAQNVVITDTLISNVQFISASAGCSELAAVITCNLGTIPVNTTATITIVVLVDSDLLTLTRRPAIASTFDSRRRLLAIG